MQGYLCFTAIQFHVCFIIQQINKGINSTPGPILQFQAVSGVERHCPN
jgi:hypothetical protein